jgi:hypothetical protein
VLCDPKLKQRGDVLVERSAAFGRQHAGQPWVVIS